MHSHAIPTVPLPNAFDAAVVIVLLLGLKKGRKNGMSEELMMTMQWIAIVVGGAFLYRPLGDMLAVSSPVSHLFCYVAVYITIAIVIKTVFSLFKKAMGGKLVGSDVFGAAEYYLGMVSGAIRYSCILLAVLALMNAPYYTKQEIVSAAAYQNDVYGSTYFPEFSGVQQAIFQESLIGSAVKNHASVLLIVSTKPEAAAIKRRKDDLP